MCRLRWAAISVLLSFQGGISWSVAGAVWVTTATSRPPLGPERGLGVLIA